MFEWLNTRIGIFQITGATFVYTINTQLVIHLPKDCFHPILIKGTIK